MSRKAEIQLYDEIGPYAGAISAKQFTKNLQDLGNVDAITVRINSPGGDVFDGLAIYNMLVRHPAKIVVHIDGLAASIASIVAMAGEEIYIAPNAFLMIHNAWSVGIGNAADHRELALLLDKIDGSLIDTYHGRTGLDKSKIRQLMSQETWFSAKEAVTSFFADEVAGQSVSATFDLSKFKQVPAAAASYARKQTNRDQYDIAAISRRNEELRERIADPYQVDAVLQRTEQLVAAIV